MTRDSSTAHLGEDRTAGPSVKANGIDLYFEIHGTGTPLVWLHGPGDCQGAGGVPGPTLVMAGDHDRQAKIAVESWLR